MRKAEILYNGTKAGELSENSRNEYVFSYDDMYFADRNQPAISLTLPKSNKVYKSERLFPFFANMLSEGKNKDVQIRALGISSNDLFGRLLATSKMDVIGAISVKEIK